MEKNPASLLLKNARIVSLSEVRDSASLLIEDGRIARILDFSEAQSIKADSVINLNSSLLFPGFIDIHIHGAAGVDTMNADADDLRRLGEFLARQGVTAWLPTLVPATVEEYRQAINAISKVMGQPQRSARALGVHYEGPFVNTEQCGALHREHFRTYRKTSDLETLPVIENDSAIHMMTMAPEIAGGIELTRELKTRNWIVSIGHTRADAKTLDQALQSGARHMTHFMNAMTPLHHRTLGAVGWGLIHDDVTCDFIADGVHIDRSILKFLVQSKNSERLSIISDAIAATGLSDGDYEIWGEQISVKDGVTQNARGSIAGSVSTMLDGVRMMRSLAFTECEVARMAAFNPAKLLGIEGEGGSIEEGKRADLVVLDDKLNVRLTIIAGAIAYRS